LIIHFYILSTKGRRSSLFGGETPRIKLTWVDEKHHPLLSPSGARGSNFYLIFYPLLANARHIKNVPGRKTDVKDCEWIAQLLRHGLITGSVIPPRPIRELRDLTRYRRKLIQAHSSELNRIHKVLEDANIKLSSVVSNINGLSSQVMIEHLIQEDMSPQQMAALARGRLRKKITELEKALEGSLREHHRLILTVSIQMIASYDTAIAKLDRELVFNCVN